LIVSFIVQSSRTAAPFKDQCFRSVETQVRTSRRCGQGGRDAIKRRTIRSARCSSGVWFAGRRNGEQRSNRSQGVLWRAHSNLGYVRFTYLIAVEIDRCTDFRSVKPSSPLSPALAAPLDEFDLQVFQQLGRPLMIKGVQGAIVPSAVGPNANVVALLDAEPPPRARLPIEAGFSRRLEFGVDALRNSTDSRKVIADQGAACVAAEALPAFAALPWASRMTDGNWVPCNATVLVLAGAEGPVSLAAFAGGEARANCSITIS